MALKTYAGVQVHVDEEGYFTNPGQWTKEIAKEMAQEEDIELTETHFAIFKFIREKVESGEPITMRSIGKCGATDLKGFYQLFPGAPLKKASKLAGVSKPLSCV